MKSASKAQLDNIHDDIFGTERLNTNSDIHPFDMIEWTERDALISNEQGDILFEQRGIEVPSSWSQLATDIAASRYFRQAGVPKKGKETSIKEMIQRIVDTICSDRTPFRTYFPDKETAAIYKDELTYLLVNQHGPFN